MFGHDIDIVECCFCRVRWLLAFLYACTHSKDTGLCLNWSALVLHRELFQCQSEESHYVQQTDWNEPRNTNNLAFHLSDYGMYPHRCRISMVVCEPWRCPRESKAPTQQLLCLACERIVASPISKCIWVPSH